jgi:hypothetical protein
VLDAFLSKILSAEFLELNGQNYLTSRHSLALLKERGKNGRSTNIFLNQDLK